MENPASVLAMLVDNFLEKFGYFAVNQKISTKCHKNQNRLITRKIEKNLLKMPISTNSSEIMVEF